MRLATRWVHGRRTMRAPDLRHIREVRSLRGLIHPRGPMRVRMAGSNVIAARNATPTPTAAEVPTVEKTPILAKLMARKVTPTVAAEAVITLPTEASA